MPAVKSCPDVHAYEQLLMGQLSAEEGERLGRHLEACADCVETVQGLKTNDTLAEALRRPRPATDTAEMQTVAVLIERLKLLHQPVDANAATAAPAEPTPSEAGEFAPVHSGPRTEVAYDFLAPAEGVDAIGQLGPYRVLQVLGTGGMGVVFKAEDPNLARPVALKAMLPALAASPAAHQRFLREARAAAAVKHDNIVTIHQVGEDRGIPFLAMEFLEGESLEDRFQRGRLPVAEVLRIGREMAEGLAAAHERGLIHRDVKPGNIWLEGKRGRVKILDFGLARAVTENAPITVLGAIVGTPAYMAPEQIDGKALDGRADLFSLGCVLYRMLTGKPAFKGKNLTAILLAVTSENPRPPRELVPEVPAALSDLVMRLLAKLPEARPATSIEVVDIIRGIETGIGAEAHREKGRPARVQ